METKRAEARAKRQKMMLEDPMMGVIPRVAIPMIISSMIDSIYNLADTFFVSQLGMNASMNDALCVCKEHFAEFWGQRLVNTMRALHDVKYNATDEADQEYDYQG